MEPIENEDLIRYTLELQEYMDGIRDEEIFDDLDDEC